MAPFFLSKIKLNSFKSLVDKLSESVILTTTRSKTASKAKEIKTMNTTQKALFSKMIETATQLPVEEMKRVLIEDAKTPKLPSVVFDAVLNALETKITEAEFIAFCEEIY